MAGARGRGDAGAATARGTPRSRMCRWTIDDRNPEFALGRCGPPPRFGPAQKLRRINRSGGWSHDRKRRDRSAPARDAVGVSAATTLALLAAALTAACTLPQLHWAFRATKGVSLSAWLQGLFLGTIWATYGAATGQRVLLLSEGAFALGSAAIAWRLLPPPRAAASVLGCIALVSTLFWLLGPGACLILASIASLTARLAQIATSVRTRSAAGVSVATWLLLAASNALWAANGVVRADTVFAWSAAAGALASLIVAVTCFTIRAPSRLG